jgi:hypothetical protein
MSSVLPRLAWIVAVGLALALTGLCRPAAAKTTHASPYTYEQTYGSALRLVKVDLGLTVVDQDAQWGYFMFEYTSPESGNRKTRGSFEFVRVRDGVQIALQLPALPSYHERVIIDKLTRKLSEEHGAPPPRPSAKDEEKAKRERAKERDGKPDESKPAPPPGDAPKEGEKKP